MLLSHYLLNMLLHYQTINVFSLNPYVLPTLNRENTSGLLSSTMEFHDRLSSHRVAAVAVPRLDTGTWLSELWESTSCSKPPWVKRVSGSDCSLLWDMSTTRRPDVGLNSCVGMLVSRLWARSNTCKQMFYRLLCILHRMEVTTVQMLHEITEWISIKCGIGHVQKRLLAL